MKLRLINGRADRRRHVRYSVPAMYTPVAIRMLDTEVFNIDGHAYDVSVGGLRFEADRPLAPGTQVAMQITLPGMHSRAAGPGRAVFAFANIVWLEDEDEPGPYKMAAVFTRFVRAGDQARLQEELMDGHYRLAA